MLGKRSSQEGLLYGRGCTRGSWRRRGYRCLGRFEHSIPLLLFTLITFVGLLTWQQVFSSQRSGGIGIEIQRRAIHFVYLGESIGRWTIERKGELPASVVSEFVAVLQHSKEHQKPFASLQQSILLQRYLARRIVNVFGLGRNRSTAAAAGLSIQTVFHFVSRYEAECFAFPLVRVLVLRVCRLSFCRYEQHFQSQRDFRVEGWRLAAILHIQPDSYGNGGILASNKFRDRSIFTTQTNVRPFTDRKLLFSVFQRLLSQTTLIPSGDQQSRCDDQGDAVNGQFIERSENRAIGRAALIISAILLLLSGLVVGGNPRSGSIGLLLGITFVAVAYVLAQWAGELL